jgi:chromate transporter
LISSGWAKEAEFGHAIGQISPGPNGLWVISLGYLTYGIPGALFALIAITLPALLVLLVLPVHASSINLGARRCGYHSPLSPPVMVV